MITDEPPPPRTKSRRDRIKLHRAKRNRRRFYTDGRSRDTRFQHTTNRFSPYLNHMNKPEYTVEPANESIQDSEDIAALFSTSAADDYAATIRMLRGEEAVAK